jgi:tetratricopeptide (TPR) repeat protein
VLFRSILSVTNRSLAERYQEAAAAALAGRHEEAYQILVVQQPGYDEPLSADYLLLQASVEIGLFDHSGALATLRDLIADTSLTPQQEQQLRLLQGLAYYGLGNNGSARQYFRLVVSLDPTSPAAVRAQALLDEIVSGSSAR